ncbi:Hypothetical predicted protein [Mytilus galloprovincialis]|uniref:Uncharacterized protein n=1 Tax=Mytilus galloprovincialis TaxID=29158 RepID=A0A8B6FUN3_MYTGA|nr:Hypothetical predicted protein [Mytilus galloprovincialis]
MGLQCDYGIIPETTSHLCVDRKFAVAPVARQPQVPDTKCSCKASFCHHYTIA